MKGSTFRRCGCRDKTGRQVKDCPRLGRERGHGSWTYRVDVGRDPVTLKRREQRKGGFKTKAAAEEQLAKVLASVSTGEHRHDAKQTVATYLPEWLDRKIADGLRPSSALMYRRYIDADIVPSLGLVRLGDLRPGHVERMLRDLANAGRGATTRRRIHAVLRSALSSAKRARLVTYNAASDVELPKLPRPKAHPWEPYELGTFLDHAAADRLGALFEVLAFTGLRRGEACALRWADVDPERGRLIVRSQLIQVDGKTIEVIPKTRSGDARRVDLGADTVAALMAHRLTQDLEHQQWGRLTSTTTGCSPARTARTCPRSA